MIYIICYTIVRAHCKLLDLSAAISDVELITCAADFQLVSVLSSIDYNSKLMCLNLLGGPL